MTSSFIHKTFMLSRFLYNGKYKDKLAMQKVIEGNL